MKTNPSSELYTFKLLDTELADATKAFEPELGKPSPRAQAALYALELSVNHNTKVALWFGDEYISTLGRHR